MSILNRLLAGGACYAAMALVSFSVEAQPQTAGLTPAAIDLLLVDWHNVGAKPKGALEERAILTRGDPNAPAHKGAVLRILSSYTYATLAPRASTEARALTNQQEVLFLIGGSGVIVSAGNSQVLAANSAVLIPANLKFSVKNSGRNPLTMYVMTEPAPEGFHANEKVIVKDEKSLPIDKPGERWSYMTKTLFAKSDGLASLESVSTVMLSPRTLGRPIAHGLGTEEIWTSLQGTTLAFLGNQLRRQAPGVTYLAPEDSETPHSNINADGDVAAKFLTFRLVANR
jgi:mannose-6-phosphate isomerase-like protein (cupin superfamily)